MIDFVESDLDMQYWLKQGKRSDEVQVNGTTINNNLPFLWMRYSGFSKLFIGNSDSL
jgi:hypothetical protein